MFAQPLKKVQTKAAASTIGKIPQQRSMPAPRWWNGPGDQLEQDADGVVDQTRTSDRASATTMSWDFAKIPILPPGRSTSSYVAAPLPGAVQTRRAFGQVNDPLEDEANRVADEVVRTPGPENSIAAAPPPVKGNCAACEEDEKSRKLQTKSASSPESAGSEPPAIVYQALRSPSQALDARNRALFEHRFGCDFSRVRVHTDPTAAEAARAINALAYTSGQHIVFNSTAYRPNSLEGQRLLAHELTHVLQQEGGRESVQRQPNPPSDDGPRDFVQSAIEAFTAAKMHFSDQRVPMNQDQFERIITGWYSMVVESQQLISTKLKDAVLGSDLRAAYIAAIRILMKRAASVLNRDENDLYRENSGRIPPWAWLVPHHHELSFSTPIPEGHSGGLTGDVTFASNGFDVTIKTDGFDNSISTDGETRAQIAAPPLAPRRQTVAGKTTIATFNAAPPTIEIQTFYRRGINAAQRTSAYGRGTTPQDIAGGKVTATVSDPATLADNPSSTTVGFHEGSHGLAYLEFIAAHPAPQFTGQVGMTIAQFNDAVRRWDNGLADYNKRLSEFSEQVVHCVGITIDELNAAHPSGSSRATRAVCHH
jgi:Domain of unknown function (DUF4157)